MIRELKFYSNALAESITRDRKCSYVVGELDQINRRVAGKVFLVAVCLRQKMSENNSSDRTHAELMRERGNGMVYLYGIHRKSTPCVQAMSMV